MLFRSNLPALPDPVVSRSMPPLGRSSSENGHTCKKKKMPPGFPQTEKLPSEFEEWRETQEAEDHRDAPHGLVKE